MTTKYAFVLFLLIMLSACKQTESHTISISGDDVVAELQRKLIDAQAGQTIILPSGKFEFKRSVSLNDTPDITIKGAGKGKTILSFKGQIEGAEGMLVKNVKGITLEGFTIADSKGDALKVQECTNVIIRDIETTWTGGKLSTNGAYGLYPVSSKNVLMENCEASYAMDAGIYVGQSQNVVVRNNYVHNNVAGLEIENTINGEVYGNIAKHNAGGMLIFDMPDLPQANGDRIKFYDNVMEDNNGENYAPKGMVVSSIPPGSGMILMSHSNIEAYNNKIIGHNTLGVAVNSWYFTGLPFESEDFDPYCSNIHVHDNIITPGNGPVDMSSDLGQLLSFLRSGTPVDILTDGIFNPVISDNSLSPGNYCFRNNGEVSFLNLNAHLGISPEAIMKNKDNDMSRFDCSLSTFDTTDHDQWLTANKE